MSRHYVDITGIDPKLLEFLGYYLIEECEEFAIYVCKGEPHMVQKKGKSKYIYVEDINDAHALRYCPSIEAP
jgi:hypothetical protein